MANEPTQLPTRTARLEMTGRDLRNMLDPVLAHAVASADPFTAPLPYVQVEVTDSTLYLFGTDRYTMGVIRRRLVDDPGPITLTVAAECLRMVLRTIKPRDEVRVDITADAVIVHRGDFQCRIPSTGDVVIDWRALVRAALKKPSRHGDLPINPTYLARFRAARRGNESLRIRPHDRLVLITCGKDFLGAVAPLYARTPIDTFAGWLPDLTPATAQAAA